MQFEAEDKSYRHGHLVQHGTISSDGTMPLDSGDDTTLDGTDNNFFNANVADFSNGPWDSIVGFGNAYPVPMGVHGADTAMGAPAPGTFTATGTALGGTGRSTEGSSTEGTSGDAAGTSGGSAGTSNGISAITASNISADDPSSGLVIIADYDSSITNLTGTTYTEVTNAISAAISFYEAAFTNSMTITIDFSYGSIDGQTLAANALGESSAEYAAINYNTLIAALTTADAGSAAGQTAIQNLPSSDPVSGAWDVSFSEAKALGQTIDLAHGVKVDATSSEIDGYVGLSSTLPLDYDPNNRAMSGEYDAIGVLEHEISEDMGRVESLGTYLGDNNYTPLDLFRYSSSGTHDYTPGPGYFSINGGTADLDEFNDPVVVNNGTTSYDNGDAGDWASSVTDDSYDAFSNIGVANTVSATDLTVMNVLGYNLAAACYAAGTRVLTAEGEVSVENLAVGDRVVARFAGLVPIKWIGCRDIDCDRHPDPRHVRPVRVAAGAFGDGQPDRDLLLSPDHAVAAGDALVPIRLLVNGASIRQDGTVRRIRYFHIELDRHDLLTTNGLQAESYLDTGNRGMFANADMPLLLHPRPDGTEAQGRRKALSCLPLRCDPADVEPVWHALAARALSLGWEQPAMTTTSDPDLGIELDGKRLQPLIKRPGLYGFALPGGAASPRLVSRSAVPNEVRPWVEDCRLLGVMVRRLTVRHGADVDAMPLDHPKLRDGWWALEYDGRRHARWTNGNAELPLALDGPAVLEVEFGAMHAYLAAGAMAAPEPIFQAARLA